jgi:hypothetical protein
VIYPLKKKQTKVVADNLKKLRARDLKERIFLLEKKKVTILKKILQSLTKRK